MHVNHEKTSGRFTGRRHAACVFVCGAVVFILAPSSAASDGGTSQTGQPPRQLELEEMKNLITEKAGAQGLTDAMLAEGLSPTGNHGASPPPSGNPLPANR